MAFHTDSPVISMQGDEFMMILACNPSGIQGTIAVRSGVVCALAHRAPDVPRFVWVRQRTDEAGFARVGCSFPIQPSTHHGAITVLS